MATITFRLPDELSERLSAACEAKRVKLSVGLRQAVESYLDAKPRTAPRVDPMGVQIGPVRPALGSRLKGKLGERLG